LLSRSVFCWFKLFALIRLRGQDKKRSLHILIVIAVLVALKRMVWEVFKTPTAFLLVTALVGVAEGIAALVLLWMLVSRIEDTVEDKVDPVILLKADS